MYFSVGAHEGYALPGGLRSYRLVFPMEETFETRLLLGSLLLPDREAVFTLVLVEGCILVLVEDCTRALGEDFSLVQAEAFTLGHVKIHIVVTSHHGQYLLNFLKSTA